MPITHPQVLPEAGDPAVPGEPVNVTQLEQSDWNANHTVTGGLAMSGDLTVTGDILPEADSTRDVGSASKAFAEVNADKVLTDRIDQGNAAAGVAFGHAPVPVTTSATDIGSSSKVWQHVHAEGVQFPATQVASADANNLDDYEEGTWTPVVTFNTVGDLSVAYTTQQGTYTKVGRKVVAAFVIETSTFTHSTATGAFQVTGLPFAAIDTADEMFAGGVTMSGWTLANVSGLTPVVQDNGSLITIDASRSGTTIATLTTASVASGGTVIIHGTVTYFTA